MKIGDKCRQTTENALLATINTSKKKVKKSSTYSIQHMIVIAYFHYDTQRSNIEKFTDRDTAKTWLYNRWGFLLEDDEIPNTLHELIDLFVNEYGVVIEMMEI